MTKKFAFINNQTFVPWGGSEVLWYETALLLRKAGHEVFVYFPKWEVKSRQAIELEKAGCQITYYNFNRGLKEKILSGVSFLKKDTLSQKSSWLKKIRPDLLVLTNLAPRGREWMQAAYNNHVKYVSISQLADELLWHSAEDLGNTAFLYKNAARIYMLSEENRIAVQKQLATSLENVEIIYNPFNVDINKPFAYPPLADGNFNLACVARLGIEHKRQDILLEIMSDQKWKNRNVFLNIYGKGFHETSLKNLSQYYGLQKIAFKGHVEDVSSVWDTNHAFVLPSMYEGVSLAMQEALISYRTSIVSKVGGVSSLIKDNVTGFVSPAATTALFDEALERAWARREEWSQIGRLAGEHIRSIIPPDPVGSFADQIKLLV
ncbi:MAG: glycosyltransferase family 4 protein [Opitutaceae bacterium]|nr:glycosyltransferase family 4 protein [Cytophagales bacterium]